MAIPLKQRISESIAALREYEFGKPVAGLIALESLVTDAHQNPDLTAQLRHELAAVLNSDASLAVTQAACKQLWILGPGEALPAVIGLLEAKDAQQAEAAFLAVARTPSPDFDLAVRKGLPRMQGNLLVAGLNFIGDRGDPEAAAVLGRFSSHSDPAVRQAAKVAAEKLIWAKRDPDPKTGFISLFDGRTLAGWNVDTPGVWTVRNGVLIGRTPGLTYNDFLRTERSFTDFTLRLRVRLLSASGNSGIQFRSKAVPNSHELAGYQADAGENLWGTLYDESRRKRTLAGPGADFHDRFEGTAWHDYEITAQGDHVLLKIDGQVTVDYRESDPDIARTGIIALQVHADRKPIEVWFRDITIRERP